MHEKLDFIKNHTIVLGYGDVGRSVVKRLDLAGVPFVVIDSNEALFLDADFSYIVGDATSESTLIKVGGEHASNIIITLGSDSVTIFSILIARKLNPDAIILTRANEVQSIDKMYKAGADYVASLTIVSGQMLGKIALLPTDHLLRDETIIMYEGIEIEKYTISSSSPLNGKSLAEIDMRNSIGCTVIGIQINGETRSEIDPNAKIVQDMTLAVLGTREQIERFRETFVR